MCPIFSIVMLQYIYAKESKDKKFRETEKENPVGWFITCVISISIIWFALGVFPIRPAVIATGSMKPIIHPGDMVLVKKLQSPELHEGDIIQFKKENVFIFHRIIEIKEVNNEIKYKTKGDNNSTSDSELVSIEDIKGTVVYVIPKIGWPTLILKTRKDVPTEKFEF